MMTFAPIPTTEEALLKTKPDWWPFLEKYSQRSKESIAVLLKKIAAHTLHLAFIWDTENEKPVALVGMQFRKEEEGELTCEIVNLVGRGLKEWGRLLPEVHEYAKHVGCTRVKTYCRRGLERFLQANDYRTTHVIMEHRL